ncbi:peptidylprolyl isomerase [Paenibacillus cymbidii]|uniref:peptidylprolyl isomerase n=1 Tax=Paenibacillus cymbidii TaxID=1639034 RepID=UPI001080394C|nr:peptidylprolyl isomerase [Paenibacillus cymbidii]
MTPTIVLRIKERTLTLKQLLQRLSIDPAWAAIERCKEDLTLVCWAESLGLAADASLLQAAVTRFRRANGLLSASQTNGWLADRGMNVDDLVDVIKPQVLRDIVGRYIITDDQVNRHFLDVAYEFDRAEISIIVVDDHGAAQELLFRVEEGADFHALAREFSKEAATARSGGYAGLFGRADLEPETAAAVFNAPVGTLLGPFDRKRAFSLIRVEGLYPAKLEDEVRDAIRKQLFQQELEAYRRSLDIHDKFWSLLSGG